MEYKKEQKTAPLRNQNNVKAYRILDIKDNHLYFQLWLNSDEQGKVKASMPEEYQVGEYIDLQVIRNSRTSYQIHLLGKTPVAFIPADGRNIAI
ncbi:hypothetical protein D3Z36_12775 [Lachnospiraceae bacterium]|nr:hypothetical protein [Lachnospiraceae bacterium]